jgi:tRNA (adenine57-N1/adenine58-N1)-methyltransferase
MAMLAVAAEEQRPEEKKKGRVIGEGDVVIVYERHDRMKAVAVARNAELQNRFGVFPHSEWIGKQFGSQVVGRNGAGFVYLLAPTPELWTLALPHRTQILYVADISFVVSFLELRPGSVVLESGTGSGSLTHSLARAVAPTGHVHTFDFHEQRASAAREDFARNGVSSVVTVKVRDIQGEGFPAELAGCVDGAFLDLPQPWLAIPSVVRSLRCDGLVCSFSPCIEQVQRTCEVLSNQRFADIRTFEVLLRSYEVRHENLSTSFDCSEEQKFSKDSIKSPPRKRQRAQVPTGEADEEGQPEEGEGHALDAGDANGKAVGEESRKPQRQPKPVIARPYPETKGHTGYLTFARQATLL